MKDEPDWMRDFRLKALDHFEKRPMPNWGADLSDIDFDDIFYYIRPAEKQGKTWDEVPEYIKNTFEKLGIPEAERKFLAGVGAQYESEVIYHSLREDLEKLGVIFLDMDSGVREHPELVKKYFGTIIPYNDNKFAALNSAVWSGGSFIYVPPGVKIEVPLQAYFRINAENMGQFERTLIIVDKDAYVHYVEGLHGADLHDEQPALGGGRDHRARRRPLPLHDDPELVEERLQPRHQAGRRLQERDHGVGRRQPRLEGDDEVPGRLADGGRRARRDPLGRVRRRRPAPGRGRQGRPRGAADVVADHLEVDLEGDRPLVLPRSGEGLQGRRGRPQQRRLRRAAPRRDQQDRHLSLHRGRGGAGLDRPRGHGLARSRTSRSST